MSFNRSDSANLLALKAEVNTDPLSIGYDPSAQNQDVIDLLNAKNYTVSKPKISPEQVRTVCTYDAYNTLSIDEQEWLRWMTGSGGSEEESLIVSDDLKVQLTGPGSASIWAAAHRTDMNSAMLALIEVSGSRAEVLFGYGTFISLQDWAAARDS